MLAFAAGYSGNVHLFKDMYNISKYVYQLYLKFQLLMKIQSHLPMFILFAYKHSSFKILFHYAGVTSTVAALPCVPDCYGGGQTGGLLLGKDGL